ncbi:MAG: hypothetical protein ACT4OS_04685 [Acidimicrobiales bacterium]
MPTGDVSSEDMSARRGRQRPRAGSWGAAGFSTRALALTLALLATACGSGNGAAGGDGGGSGSGEGEGAGTTVTTSEPIGVPSGEVPPGSGGCKLVSEAEVGSAVGSPVTNVGSGGRAEGQVCTFTVDGKTDPPQTVLVVTATNDESASAFDAARKDAGTKAQTVSGLGDRAFTSGGQIVALKGRTVLLVVVGLDKPESALVDTAKKVAETVMDRL